MFLIIDREMQRVLRSLPQENANRMMLGFLMFFLGVFLLGLSGGYAVPADLFSTALWFDNQGMPLVFGIRFSLWNILGGGRETSLEGAVFSIIITLMTWSLAFKSMRALSSAEGNYGGGHQNPLSLTIGLVRGNTRPQSINWDIVTPLIQMWMLVLFDVFTGAEFRAGGTASWFVSFLVAFLFENVLSDSALIAGFQLAITGGMVLYKLFRVDDSPPTGQQGRVTQPNQPARNDRPTTPQHRQPPPPPASSSRGGIGRLAQLTREEDETT